jgi:hypothetical protein
MLLVYSEGCEGTLDGVWNLRDWQAIHARKVAPTGTLRVILRGGRVEVHHQIEDTAVTSAQKSAHRGCGAATVGGG